MMVQIKISEAVKGKYLRIMAVFTVAIENNLTAKNLAWSALPHPLTFESINYSMRPYF